MATPYLPAGPDQDGDWFADDAALRRIASRWLDAGAWKALEPRLAALGKDAPRRLDALARRADAHGPRLVGNEVEYDESYHELRRAAREHEVFTYSWRHGAPRLATFALGYIYAQAESGYYCPACMTDGAAWVLARHASPELAARLVPRLTSARVEGAAEGAMLLTEPQGGSDVGATQTVATPAAGGWTLRGAKWFASNAGAEVVLTLARMPGSNAEGTRGLGLFLMEPHGDAGFARVKLKEKLGVRSMATAEVELRDARATLVAAPPDGFRAMADMVNLSRLYNAVASVAIARRALREGRRNGSYRVAFGKPLVEQPMYRRALLELENDVRGALFVTLDAARAFDRAAGFGRGADGRVEDPVSQADPSREDGALMRALTPIAKAGTARLAVDAASQACEFLGGNGYVEEWVTPRLLRDAQVLPIWEGTSNIQALDLLRAARKDGAVEALRDDSLRRSPPAALAEAWRALEREVPERAALRWLMRCYHLRAATLLAEDAADGDADAQWHARAYLARRVARDETDFEAML